MTITTEQRTKKISGIHNTFSKEEYFRYGDIILFKGNSLDENLFKAEFIDLIVTSPPYNVGVDYNSNNDDLSYIQYLEFSENGCLIVINGVILKQDFC